MAGLKNCNQCDWNQTTRAITWRKQHEVNQTQERQRKIVQRLSKITWTQIIKKLQLCWAYSIHPRLKSRSWKMICFMLKTGKIQEDQENIQRWGTDSNSLETNSKEGILLK